MTVSLGVAYPFFSEKLPVKKDDGKVTFVGNMATPANADSVRYIIDQVLPNSRMIKNIVFVGKCPESLREEYEKNEKVFFTGKVDDLRMYVTGIKTKILEAMAMGMPVVTNSIGAEGIPGVNGKHWYASDDSKEIAHFVDDLLMSQDMCNEIGKNAQKFVEATYQWDIIFEQFKELGL